MTKRKLVCAYAINCELLDELSEENEELKSENQYLKSLKWNQDCINEISIGMQQRQSLEISNNKLIKENEQLKQFKDNVFDLIDRNIKETKELFEDGKIDLISYNGAMIILIGLKEELKGDGE